MWLFICNIILWSFLNHEIFTKNDQLILADTQLVIIIRLQINQMAFSTGRETDLK